MRYTAILKSDNVQIILTQICMQTQKVLFFRCLHTHACVRILVHTHTQFTHKQVGLEMGGYLHILTQKSYKSLQFSKTYMFLLWKNPYDFLKICLQETVIYFLHFTACITSVSNINMMNGLQVNVQFYLWLRGWWALVCSYANLGRTCDAKHRRILWIWIAPLAFSTLQNIGQMFKHVSK